MSCPVSITIYILSNVLLKYYITGSMRSYNNHTTIINNDFSHMMNHSVNQMGMGPNDQRRANEQVQAEEKRSLTALNFFISKFL